MANDTSRTARRSTVLLASALSAGLLVATLTGGSAAAAGAAPAASGELVVNGSFEKSLTGWRTNSRSTQSLWRSPAVSAKGTASAKLSRAGSSTGNVVLNDKPNTVISVPTSGRYRATVSVRSAGQSMSGQLRVREVAGTSVTAHKSSVSLKGTAWKTVTLDFTAARGASLDVNVIMWKLKPGASFYVDAVSLVRQDTPTSTPTPGPTPDPTPDPTPTGGRLTNDCTYSLRGMPECGVLFGAAVGSNTDPASFESQLGGNLGVRRTYWGASNSNSSVRVAADDVANRRVPWLSYKLPYSWAEMADGKGDAWAVDLIRQLDEVDGPVWVAFHHEPENDGDIREWVSMQRHLAPLVHRNSDNVAMTMVVTGWHQLYGESQYSLDNIWPGDGLVDLIGFDIYNQYGVVKDGKTNTKGTDLADSYYPQISAFAKKHGVEWGLGETGFTDRAAQDDPQWLQRTYQQTKAWGGSAIAYFNTPLNSIGSWVITTPSKTDLFADVLKASPTLR
ncbi:carbohydrate-binding protein CenC [Cellulomonas sp.]|uniref:carbohydrate-binding protein CenC n=1 Tax=Cellulomonas sp. TaxID=40001 RepID=UPI00258C5E4E|nr:carbohydrate-binding protein CenC [Cellulomonas sp.]MCR6688022.1 carbohydrate-binding protein CenC [Cellulomonas sp.]